MVPREAVCGKGTDDLYIAKRGCSDPGGILFPQAAALNEHNPFCPSSLHSLLETTSTPFLGGGGITYLEFEWVHFCRGGSTTPVNDARVLL